MVLAGSGGVVAGFGARAIVDNWLRRHGYRPVVTFCCVPQCAVATGWVVVGALNTSVVQLFSGLAVVWWCVAISTVDLAVRRLPNSFTLPGYAVVMVYATVSGTVWVAVVGVGTARRNPPPGARDVAWFHGRRRCEAVASSGRRDRIGGSGRLAVVVGVCLGAHRNAGHRAGTAKTSR